MNLIKCQTCAKPFERFFIKEVHTNFSCGVGGISYFCNDCAPPYDKVENGFYYKWVQVDENGEIILF